jgi:hypothetical protein
MNGRSEVLQLTSQIAHSRRCQMSHAISTHQERMMRMSRHSASPGEDVSVWSFNQGTGEETDEILRSIPSDELGLSLGDGSPVDADPRLQRATLGHPI